MKPGEIMLYDSVLSSNIPVQEKSQLRKLFEKATGSSIVPSFSKAGKHVHGGLSAFRQGSESLLAGAALGGIHAEFKGGLDAPGFPVDGALGVLLTVGSAIGAESEVAPDARNVGSTCLGIWSFRATTNLLTEKKLAKGKAVPAHLTPGTKIAGDDGSMAGEDPILRVAKTMG